MLSHLGRLPWAGGRLKASFHYHHSSLLFWMLLTSTSSLLQPSWVYPCTSASFAATPQLFLGRGFLYFVSFVSGLPLFLVF